MRTRGAFPPTSCRGTKRRRSRGCAASGAACCRSSSASSSSGPISRSRTVTFSLLETSPTCSSRSARPGSSPPVSCWFSSLGEIDLSVGSVAGLASAVLALLLVHGVPWWLSVIAMIAAGACAGLIQGAWIVAFGVPSFIVTLAGLLGFYGLQLYLIQTQNSGRDPCRRALHRRPHHDLPPRPLRMADRRSSWSSSWASRGGAGFEAIAEQG